MDDVPARIDAGERSRIARAASNAAGSWFVMAMSSAAPLRCLERVAPPMAQSCPGLRWAERTINGLPSRSRSACNLSRTGPLLGGL